MKQGWLLLLLLVSVPTFAQVKAYQSRPPSKSPAYVPHTNPPYPPQCLDVANRDNPWLQALCSSMMRGHPLPSSTVLQLPAHGSAEAKRTGFECLSGMAMKRLANGWEQVLDTNRNFVRCTVR